MALIVRNNASNHRVQCAMKLFNTAICRRLVRRRTNLVDAKQLTT